MKQKPSSPGFADRVLGQRKVKRRAIVDASITDTPHRPRGRKEYEVVEDRREEEGGCVESRQSESREVTAASHTGQSVYEIYTFPRPKNNVLRVQVTAHDAGSNVRVEKVFEDVPIERNCITQYTGAFFGGNDTEGEIGTNAVSWNLTSEDEWRLTNYGF